VFRKDAEGRYILVNAEFCRLYGREASQFLGKTPLEIAGNGSASPVSPRHQSELHYLKQGGVHHEQIMRMGRTIELEEQYPTEDGLGQVFQVIKSPVFDADGKVTGSQGILTDITQRKLA